MGNSNFESHDLICDEDIKLSLFAGNAGSKKSTMQSMQSRKSVLEGYGKVPRFGNGRVSSQQAASEISEGHKQRNNFPASQQSRASTRPKSQEVSTSIQHAKRSSSSPAAEVKEKNEGPDSRTNQLSPGSPKPMSQVPSMTSQDFNNTEFKSKDKMFWYQEFKREKALNRKLTKRLERLTVKFNDIRNQVTILSEKLN